MPWVSPSIRCKFGPYFKADPEEQVKVVTMAQLASGSPATAPKPLIPKRAAIEAVAHIFGLENIEAVEDALEEEQKEADEAAAEKVAQQAEANAKVAAAGVKPPEPLNEKP